MSTVELKEPPAPEVLPDTRQDLASNGAYHSWENAQVDKPARYGVQVFNNYPLQEIADYVDWSPFFWAWDLRGVFPKILDHPRHGEQARELYTEAQEMFDEIIRKKRMRANAVIGLWPANSDGDDINIYCDTARSKTLGTLHMLRQQQEKLGGSPYLCLADFVAPEETGKTDTVGAFAVTAGCELDEWAASFEKDQDDYRSIMVKAIGDRLAEALAERTERPNEQSNGRADGEVSPIHG